MGGSLDDADGDAPVEGDTENDTLPTGGVDPARLGRTNKLGQAASASA